MGAQGGTLKPLRAVWYSTPVRPWTGATLPMSDKRPPAGLVGIPRLCEPLATPTLPASEALESQLATPGCRETTSPLCANVGRAVLVPPTGNGVLNQIPAGDGRESSREQVVLADGAPLYWANSHGAGRPYPLIVLS